MFVIKSRKIIISITLSLIFISSVICISAMNNSLSDKADAKVFKVVIDAGHGGIDGGVSGAISGVKESDINLSVSNKLSNYFISGGFSVTLTRSTEAGLYGSASGNLKRKDMLRRKEIIEKAKPNVVISIHMNKFSISTRRGAQVFYKANDEKGKLLANCVQESFNNMEEASRKCSALCGDYYILNCSKYPSIIAECGFLSNPQDEALLVTDEYQDKLAYTIYKGVIEYLTILESK